MSVGQFKPPQSRNGGCVVNVATVAACMLQDRMHTYQWNNRFVQTGGQASAVTFLKFKNARWVDPKAHYCQRVLVVFANATRGARVT